MVNLVSDITAAFQESLDGRMWRPWMVRTIHERGVELMWRYLCILSEMRDIWAPLDAESNQSIDLCDPETGLKYGAFNDTTHLGIEPVWWRRKVDLELAIHWADHDCRLGDDDDELLVRLAKRFRPNSWEEELFENKQGCRQCGIAGWVVSASRMPTVRREPPFSAQLGNPRFVWRPGPAGKGMTHSNCDSRFWGQVVNGS